MLPVKRRYLQIGYRGERPGLKPEDAARSTRWTIKIPREVPQIKTIALRPLKAAIVAGQIPRHRIFNDGQVVPATAGTDCIWEIRDKPLTAVHVVVLLRNSIECSEGNIWGAGRTPPIARRTAYLPSPSVSQLKARSVHL